jgi:hypothetical protein
MTRAAAALTWDGVRFPATRLPARERAFLGPITPARELAKWLDHGGPGELRLCWVPQLKGGPATLLPPFATPDGKRVAFRLVKTVQLGASLGVVYRRRRGSASTLGRRGTRT